MTFVKLNAARRNYHIASTNLDLARKTGSPHRREAELAVLGCIDQLALIQSTIANYDAIIS